MVEDRDNAHSQAFSPVAVGNGKGKARLKEVTAEGGSGGRDVKMVKDGDYAHSQTLSPMVGKGKGKAGPQEVVAEGSAPLHPSKGLLLHPAISAAPLVPLHQLELKLSPLLPLSCLMTCSMCYSPRYHLHWKVSVSTHFIPYYVFHY